MAYETYYTIGVQDYGKAGTTNEQIFEKISEMFDNDSKFYPFESSIEDEEYEGSNGGFELECDGAYDWGELDEEMEELSKAFPDVVFTILGDGEESGDLWIEYWKDGKSVRHYATFPEYNPDDLE